MYARVVHSDERMELLAVADEDAARVGVCAGRFGAEGFTDCRSLIVECCHSGLDVLLVALEPFESLPYVELAGERGIGVFHKSPPARNVREMQRITERFSDPARPLVVSRLWHFDPALFPLRNASESIGQVYTVAICVSTDVDAAGWRGDSARSGGGVLLNGAYEAVDLLVHLMGLPDAVYAQCARHPEATARGRYETEDAAIVSLRFAAGQIASVTARRGAAEPSCDITLVGAEHTLDLHVGAGASTPGPEPGSEPGEIEVDPSVKAAVRSFAESCLMSDVPFVSVCGEHLATLATIESAYLSARTGAPETPARLLR
jgi:predicted dehydrogenase